MELTNGEKLIVLMLSEIYDKLHVNGEMDPEFLRAAIFDDALWSISWKYPGIPFKDDETPELVKEVIDILDMWSLIELSYERLPADEIDTLANEVPSYMVPPTFRGFDGNNESQHLSTTYFVINRLDRFVEFKGRDLNSHIQILPRYRIMLGKLATLPRNHGDYLLSATSLAELLSAG
ncbi:MAG: YfbU family protein [Blastocatellia bacterium]|nr:YfbU family protein [Blastocatellia bacterium]